jgi:integrase
LRWTDIDLGQGRCRIDRAISTGKDGDVEGPTKTKNKRTIDIHSGVVEVLQAHREWCLENCHKCGIDLPANAFLFSQRIDCTESWTPSSPSQHFRRIRNRVPGLENTTLHDLRHFHVTQLLSEGLDLASVAYRVGHGGGGRTTLAIYAHSMPSSDTRAAEISGALFVKK